MSDRLSYVLLAVLGVALLATNVIIKPAYDPKSVQSFAQEFSAQRQWESRVAPDIELTLRDGSPFHLADHVGREVVILNFFATWCVPCRTEMPELQRFVDRMAAESQKVRLLAIDAGEQPDLVDRFVRDLGVRLPVAIDVNSVVTERYEVTAFPTTVIIGVDGRVASYLRGAISNTDVAFEPVVRSQLQKLTTGGGISRDDYLAALQQLPPSSAKTMPSDTGMAELFGRARSIAEAMPCPCGCVDRVSACTCQTAKAIKARLKEGVQASLTDAQVMEALNREFCMKGM